MPFISEAASAIKSRFGFHERRNSSESSPDLLKSSSKVNSHHRVHSLDLQSVGDKEDRVDSLNRSFEFNEDPSFWNDHNVQVVTFEELYPFLFFIFFKVKASISHNILLQYLPQVTRYLRQLDQSYLSTTYCILWKIKSRIASKKRPNSDWNFFF